MTSIGIGFSTIFGSKPPAGGGVAAPSYAISGATTGVALAQSGNITITGSNLTGPVTITFTSDDPGDTFDLPSVVIDVGDEIKNIKITPDGTLGARNITFSSAPAITNPAPWTYTATAPSSGWTADSTTITADSTLVTADMT